MSFDEFENIVKNKIRPEKRCWEIRLIIPMIGLSTMTIYYNITKNKYGNIMPLPVTLLLISLIIFLGYCYYKLTNKYQITIYNDNHNIDLKFKAIQNILERLRATHITQVDNYFTFNYQKNMWKVTYEYFLYYDDNQFAFLANGRGFNGGGLIDFGSANRMRKKLLNEISSELMFIH